MSVGDLGDGTYMPFTPSPDWGLNEFRQHCLDNAAEIYIRFEGTTTVFSTLPPSKQEAFILHWFRQFIDSLGGPDLKLVLGDNTGIIPVGTIAPGGMKGLAFDLPPELGARLSAGQTMELRLEDEGTEWMPGEYIARAKLVIGGEVVGGMELNWSQPPGTKPCLGISGAMVVPPGERE